MNYLMSQLVDGVHVIAVEDKETWDVMSYTNLYVLKRPEQIILIDAGLSRYQPAVAAALARLDIKPDMVTDVLLTHGHPDHVQGVSLFKHARKFVHSADLPMLPACQAGQFIPYAPQQDETKLTADGVEHLDIVLVNTHTPGSVAIYDRLSKALFIGDFFCYFGEALPDGKLVDYCQFCRQGSCNYVAGQAASGGAEFDQFLQGLSRLLAFDAEFFCTGHGIVLKDDIQSFLKAMWRSGSEACKVK